MTMRSHLTALLCATALFVVKTLAQSKPEPSTVPTHTELTLATSSFIDVGPPFDYYTLYQLSSKNDGTDIERIAITPPADSCLIPATTEVSQAHIQQSIDDLLNHKDPCTIPDKALRKEIKRCKHCLTFSGIHIEAQLQCNSKPRTIRYEVLDRDLFGAKPGTPSRTSQTLKMLDTLNKAFGHSEFDQPIFPTANDPPPPVAMESDPLIQKLATGAFDNLFSESVSHLYKDSQQPHRSALVTIEASSPSHPVAPKMPTYPPIARAAHIGGVINLRLQLDSEGKVIQSDITSGPELLRGTTLDATRSWFFPSTAAASTQDVTIKFDLNCNNFSTSSN